MEYLLKKNWWKWVCVGLLVYTVIGGLLMPAPRLPILNETIRNIHFHVPMWFGMVFLLIGSVVYAIKYLNKVNPDADLYSQKLAVTGVGFGVLGLITGMIWARFTWGAFWSNDPKQNTSAICMLIYLAYFVLRNAIEDPEQRSRIAAVYNVFAFFMMIALLFILPRMTDSLHPGNGGNPGFNSYDLDSDLRKVFYPAVIGWTLLGYWVASVSIRIAKTEQRLIDTNH